MRRVIISAVAGISLLAFGGALTGVARANPSAPISITSIETQCKDGNVIGKVWVKNVSGQDVDYHVHLILTQQVPSSQVGSFEFVPVHGAVSDVSVAMVSGKEEGEFDGLLSTSQVDPRADFLRVELNRAADRTLSAEPSQPFLPCAEQTPVADATALPVEPATLEPSAVATEEPIETPVAIATVVPPSAVPAVQELPSTGGGSQAEPKESSDKIIWIVGPAVLAFAVIAGLWRARTARRR